jgi:hypothetical protein
MLLVEALRTKLASHAGIARVLDTRTLPAVCPPITDDSLDTLECRAFVDGYGAELMIVVKPGSFFDNDRVPGHGISHGSPYAFDRDVPFVVRAVGLARAGDTIDSLPYATFTRTLASLIDVDPPSSVRDARDLASAH